MVRRDGAHADTRTARPSWLVRSTSPLHCVIAFAAGAWLQHALALPIPPEGMPRDAMHVAGTVLANAGGLLALWCFAMFAWRRTTIMPGGAPSGLVLRGPYRLSRNPIYVGMLASYAGLALMLDVPWALVLLPLPVWVLQRAIVPHEEAQLRARFGAGFDAYAAKVPRWV